MLFCRGRSRSRIAPRAANSFTIRPRLSARRPSGISACANVGRWSPSQDRNNTVCARYYFVEQARARECALLSLARAWLGLARRGLLCTRRLTLPRACARLSLLLLQLLLRPSPAQQYDQNPAQRDQPDRPRAVVARRVVRLDLPVLEARKSFGARASSWGPLPGHARAACGLRCRRRPALRPPGVSRKLVAVFSESLPLPSRSTRLSAASALAGLLIKFFCA